MKSFVKLVKSRMGVGYFLTIGESETGVENRWAVTKEELIMVYAKIKKKLEV